MKAHKANTKLSLSLGMALLLSVFLSTCGRQQAQSPFPPTVIAVSPLNGATNVPLNSLVTATFSSVMARASINSTTFTVTGLGGAAVAGTVSLSGTTATFTPATTLSSNTLFTATITTGATDPGGNALASNFVWTFMSGALAVISTIPANGAMAVAVNTIISATFNEAMNAATINGATFTVTGPGATPVAGVVTYSGTTATFTPASILAANTLYTATITTGAQDPAGNAIVANFVWSFTTDVSPTVISTVPAAGAAAVAINTTVTATFSRAMDPTTINGATFTLTGPGVTPVAGAVIYAGTTATFTPSALLVAGTVYTATITTGAKDPTGNALAANFVWTFTTDVPPTVVSTVPINGATLVPVATLVTATFSRAMDPSTITGATFTLNQGATVIAGAVTYAGTTATFTPASNLTAGALFTATITTGAKDPTGNALAANFVWTFTTAPAPNVTSTNPASAAINVPLNQKITATFNQPMTPASITAAGTFSVAVTAGGAPVAGVVTYDPASNTAIFTPTANLTASTQFTATTTTAAKSAANSPLPSNYVWSFTTGTITNATAPTVSSTIPISGAITVPLNQRVTATFSEAMDPATISAPGTVVVVVTAGGAVVPGTVAYDTGSRTVIFEPTANLTAATQYTATISNAAKDLAGNALVAGAVPNPWSFTTGALVNNTRPTITVTSPASGATNVPLSKTISATFSAAMDPMTINNGSFTVSVAGPGGAPVNGTVVYDAASQIATFTPSANLAASTQYTANISNGVEDLSGNALAAGAAPNPWNFTTGTTVAGSGQAPINLGSAAAFAIMATSSIVSTGPGIVNGDVGLDPGSAQGIPPAQVNGTIHVNDPVIVQAQADLLAAYNDAVGRSTNSQTLPGNMGGLTFTPGLYTNSTSVLISGAGANNNVTLDAQGDPNAVFIFQMGSTLTTGTGSQVILAGGAKAANIFWQVGTSATIDTTTIFKGNVLAAVSITMNTGAVVEGRMFAGSGGGAASLTFNALSITVPAP